MARTSATGDELTLDEELIVGAIESGTYFVENEVPSGTINGSNTSFTLASSPNPASSLDLFVNGQKQKAGGEDFSLSGSTITMVLAPESGDILLANYRVDPT